MLIEANIVLVISTNSDQMPTCPFMSISKPAIQYTVNRQDDIMNRLGRSIESHTRIDKYAVMISKIIGMDNK